jgi:hypothetical protein
MEASMWCFVLGFRDAVVVVVVVLLATGVVLVQADVGTDFWLTFPFDNAVPGLSLELVLVSESDTIVTIAAPYFATIPLTARVPTRVPIPPAAIPLPNLVMTDAVHVSAPDPLMVSAVGAGAGSVGSFRVTPTALLGTDYLVLTYPSDGTVGGSAFAVIATQDATAITVTTTVSTGGIPAFVPVQLQLDRGDTIYVFADGNPGDDLTGSTVVADAPVAVIAANTCAFVPLSSTGFCDQTVEQLAPTTSLGTEVVVVPSAGRTASGDILRIAAVDDGTVLSWDPAVPGAPGVLNARQFAEVAIVEPVHVTANHPIEGARFSLSSVASLPGEPGDASQIEVRPTTDFANRHTFSIDNYGSGGSPAFWADIVTTATGCVLVDGHLVPPGAFAPVGAGPYVTASISVGAGRHVVESDPVSSVSIYGFADWEGNGTTAASQLGAVDCGIFHDGFESGNTTEWSSTTP